VSFFTEQSFNVKRTNIIVTSQKQNVN